MMTLRYFALIARSARDNSPKWIRWAKWIAGQTHKDSEKRPWANTELFIKSSLAVHNAFILHYFPAKIILALIVRLWYWEREWENSQKSALVSASFHLVRYKIFIRVTFWCHALPSTSTANTQGSIKSKKSDTHTRTLVHSEKLSPFKSWDHTQAFASNGKYISLLPFAYL